MAYILLFLELAQGDSSTPPPPRIRPWQFFDTWIEPSLKQLLYIVLQTKRNYSFQTQNRLIRYMQIFVKIHNAILRDISMLIYSNSFQTPHI